MNAMTRLILRRAQVQLWPVLAGLALWLVAVAAVRPPLFDPAWARLVLVLAPLVLVPLGLPLFRGSKARGWARPAWLWAERVMLPAGLCFGLAYWLEPGPVVAALAVPWLLLTGCLAVLGLERLGAHRRGPLGEVCLDLSLVFLFVGALWAVADRLAYRPLDFEEAIVLLTGIHFHYAGYALPLVTGLLLQEDRRPLARLAGLGVIVGIPLVAVAITSTRLGGGLWTEAVAAWVLGGAGLAVAWMLAGRATSASAAVRGVWLVAAASLAGGMVLAVAYGSRGFVEVGWLDLPWMRALHGTANALGFAPLALAGFRLRGMLGG